MRIGLLLLLALAVDAQTPPEAAYKALEAKQYDEAISWFIKAIADAPAAVGSFRKDLAYTYLKVGERELARDQFGEAMRLDPGDTRAAMEYAFLCFETHKEAEARRIFDRLRRSSDPAIRDNAETAFQNIDQPLAAAIARWTEALRKGDNSFGTYHELAQIAEQRDELALAAEHYEKAWRIATERKSVLVELGRVWKAMGREEDATAALLASRYGGEARASESARELLPSRYPFVYEFENALKLDPGNGGLRREFGYLLLRMDRQSVAEQQFQILAGQGDLLAAAQLGFLLLARNDVDAAKPLLNRVLNGTDADLANRVRAVLRMEQVDEFGAFSAFQMAERSIKAGYLKDGRKYLELAHDADPVDFAVMARLGWICNLLHDDEAAVGWFDLARKSPDPEIAGDAERSWRNLRPDYQPVRISAWALPMYSSRWRDTFSYGQVKATFNLRLPVQPYLSTRIIADTRSEASPVYPLYFSESAVIAAVGLSSRNWHGAVLWGEAGSAIGYLSHHALPDYRGGLSFARSRGKRWFVDTTADALFLSRFQNDGMLYVQNRAGYTVHAGDWDFQFYANGNVTVDAKRQYWANYAEGGPGVRIRTKSPEFPVISLGLLRGAYTVNESNPRRPNFFDFRIGLWYAFSH